LNLRECESLTNILGLKECTSLHTLDLTECFDVTDTDISIISAIIPNVIND